MHTHNNAFGLADCNCCDIVPSFRYCPEIFVFDANFHH